MRIMFFDPTSTSGPDGYINYKMSGGGSGGNGGNNSGCGVWICIVVIIMVLYIIWELS